MAGLEIAWMYNAAEQPNPLNPNQSAKAIQCQPIVVDGILYGTTPDLKLFALNAASGKEIWKFFPKMNDQRFNTSRGVMFWEKGSDKRILYTVGSSLYAVNIETGKIVTSFGKDGVVDLRAGLSEGLDTDVNLLSVSATTPGVIYKNTLVIGSSVSEGGDAAPGYIRAFDVITGRLKWVFHTIPHPGEFGYDTWPKDAYKSIGGVNSWSGIVLDEKRGLVFLEPDRLRLIFTGVIGKDAGTESYGGPVVTAGGLVFIAATKDERIRAFDKKTGKTLWQYQLPAGGFANPITYQVKGKQYVVIAAGGARGQKSGGNYIAFSLK